MAIQITLSIISPNDRTFAEFERADLTSALLKMEENLADIVSFTLQKRPDDKFNFDVTTPSNQKRINQVVTVNHDNPDWSLTSGNVQGEWRACESLAVIEVLKKVVGMHARLDYTLFSYTKATI